MVVNADDLIPALEAGEGEAGWYLDLTSGAGSPRTPTA
jgi:hypothetical protein